MMNSIRITDLISNLDENIVENICWDEKNTVDISASAICAKVGYELHPEKKRHKISFKVAMAICAILIMSVPCYALISNHLEKAEVVDDSNRHLIGKEVVSDYYIVYDGIGNYTDSYGNSAENIEDLIKDEPAASRLVNSIEDESLDPRSYTEILPEKVKGKKTVFPEIIMINNSVCILTEADGTGWELKQGDSLIYEYEKAASEVVETQTLLIGVIQDGVLKDPSVSRVREGTFSVVAEEDCEYFIYLLSASSDYLTIREGIVGSDN